MDGEPEDDHPVSEAEMRANLAALTSVIAERERLPRYTEAWEPAVEAEERAAERVQRWLGRR